MPHGSISWDTLGLQNDGGQTCSFIELHAATIRPSMDAATEVRSSRPIKATGSAGARERSDGRDGAG